MARAAPRTYLAELKAEFLRLVREREIISTVAHELGIHRPTAYAWARKAGISTSEARKVKGPSGWRDTSAVLVLPRRDEHRMHAINSVQSSGTLR